MSRNRYPGTKPFSTEQEALFHGREQEVSGLFREIRLNDLMVLHGKSGLGKSSLLNAGVIPRLKTAGFTPLSVRFGASTYRSEAGPLDITRAVLSTGDTEENLARLMPPEENSLWYHLLQYRERSGTVPVLLFDQFEELFTYPPEEVTAFARELAEALAGRVPDRVERMRELLAATGIETDAATQEKLYRPLDLRVAFSIRSDRIHLLDRLAAYLPDVQRNRYLLQPLSEEGARQAIVLPAGMEGDYDTPSFAYSPDALQKIIGKLADREGRIEGIQLQILCQSFEEKVQRANGQLTTLGADDLGDLDDLLGNYYQDRIAALGSPNEQNAARRLIEEGLVVESDKTRTPMAEGQILEKYKVGPELLKKLVDSHLLRMEPSRLGEGYTYELSHDTLVEPVLEAKKERRERLRRRRLLGVVFLSLALLAGAVAGGLWVRQQWAAAEKATKEAKRQASIAQEKDSLSQIAALNADKAAQLARMEKTRADSSASVAIAEQRRASIALQNLVTEQARTKQALRDVAQLLSGLIEEDILNLQYEAAAEKLKAFEQTEQKLEFLIEKYIEFAFLHAEANDIPAALEYLRQLQLVLPNLGKSTLNSADVFWSEADRYRIRAYLQELDAGIYTKYLNRYYSEMVAVPGGSFEMGSEEGGGDEQPVHTVILSDYQIARTETTVWQFALYCRATGQDIRDFSPGWGLEGDNPIVNVNWYQATAYANWVSKQFGLDTAYVFDTEGDFQAIRKAAGQAFRLPTEAQWEYAARGGTFRSPFRYSGSDEPDEVAWYRDNSELNGVRRTHPVGQKKANALGLYDMSGNVWEWCQDWYGEYPDSTVTDPRGPVSGNVRVLRGGSWDDDPRLTRVALRYWYLTESPELQPRFSARPVQVTLGSFYLLSPEGRRFFNLKPLSSHRPFFLFH